MDFFGDRGRGGGPYHWGGAPDPWTLTHINIYTCIFIYKCFCFIVALISFWPSFRYPSGCFRNGTLPVSQIIKVTLYKVQCTFFFEPLLMKKQVFGNYLRDFYGFHKRFKGLQRALRGSAGFGVGLGFISAFFE